MISVSVLSGRFFAKPVTRLDKTHLRVSVLARWKILYRKIDEKVQD